MINLNELVLKYKKSKDSKILEQIFKELEPNLEKKTNYVFNKLKFSKLEKNDIKQELYVTVLKIIKDYNIKKPFENYLFSGLKNWLPEIAKEDTTYYQPLYEVPIEKCQTNIRESLEEVNIDEIFKNLTKQEKKVVEILAKNPEFTHSQIGETIGVTRQRIEFILKNIRKKVK